MTVIDLPGAAGHTMRPPRVLPPPVPPRSRVLYAAAHVVADPSADNGPGRPAVLDWDATLRFRRHLWTHGLGVAEAMDTAQRGAGLDWSTARELIRRTAELAGPHDRLACGVGTDQLTGPADPAAVTAAYREQLEHVTAVGATPILMCSRALAATATGPGDYLAVYDRLLSGLDRPVVLHWLGPMFDPALAGYWGSTDLSRAADTLLDLVAAHDRVVDGVKLSLLDAGIELAFRRRLPAGVRCYTGDDFHYPPLIAGDERGHSDALLGVFDPLAPLVSEAMRFLDAGDPAGFRAVLDPTVDLARAVFAPPTRHYKTGVVFLAWLSGHQDRFRMVDGRQTARSIRQLTEVFLRADALGLFPDPDLAARRFAALLTKADR